MGGYDAQTVGGVISTSTHGSGIAFGPIADAVRSLDFVAGGGRLVRIEPVGGPAAHASLFQYHEQAAEDIQQFLSEA